MNFHHSPKEYKSKGSPTLITSAAAVVAPRNKPGSPGTSDQSISLVSIKWERTSRCEARSKTRCCKAG